MKLKYFIAGLCAASLLMTAGCQKKVNNDIITTQPMPHSAETAIIDIPDKWLKREIPQSYKGDGSVFDLKEEDYKVDTTVPLTPVKLNCSDGTEQTGYSLTSNPIYLSDEEDQGQENPSANGVCSFSGNVTLLTQIGTLQGDSIQDILNDIVQEQAEAAREDSVLMVSHTLRLSPNVLLTNTILKEESACMESFYLVQVIDKETIQLIVLRRVSEESNLTEEELRTMDTEELIRQALSSSENREVFCGMLQYLMEETTGQEQN